MTWTCDKFCQPDSLEFPWESPWGNDSKSRSREFMLPRSPPHYCTRLHVPRRSIDFQYSTMPAEHTEPSPHHVLILLTAKRPQSTLEKTLSSMLDAGFDRWPGARILSADGITLHNALANCMSWHLYESPSPLGSAHAFIRCLRLALAVDPDLDLLTFLEDDIELCKNALDYMSRVLVPADIAFLTWFTYNYDWSTPRHVPVKPTPEIVAYDTHRGILACRPARFFILSQACTFPRRTIDLLLSCPHITTSWPKPDSHDEMFAWTLGDALYAAHFPVLLQHTGGLNSAVALSRGESSPSPQSPQDGLRQSLYYVGRDFDALSLLETQP
jgi:hypothetical protein